MKLLADITIPGQPHAQGRARARRQGKGVTIYDPPDSSKWKRGAAMVMRMAAPKPLPLCDELVRLGVELIAVHKRPVKLSKIRYPRRSWYEGPKDQDNIAKCCLDAATQAGLWHDDRQVVRLDVWSCYAAADEEPHVQLRIVTLDDLSQEDTDV